MMNGVSDNAHSNSYYQYPQYAYPVSTSIPPQYQYQYQYNIYNQFQSLIPYHYPIQHFPNQTQQQTVEKKQNKLAPTEQHKPHSIHSQVSPYQRQQQTTIDALKQTRLKQDARLTNIMSFPSNNVLTDKYIAIKRIGTGTFGDIWKVMEKYDINESSQGEYAIKVIKPLKKCNLQRKQKYETMFLSEGKRILNLNKIKTNEIGQNFIIHCKEVIAGPCIVMELCDYSLSKYMKMHQMSGLRIPLDTIRYITIQILSALSFMHGIGNCTHADLKPDNILLKNVNNGHSQYPSIKIVDFGNAITMNKKIKSFNIQTLWYRAPELLFGNTNDLSPLIDIWSIGCILFELVSVSNPRHYRLFQCRNLNKVDVVYKIYHNLCQFPVYCYNVQNSYYFDQIYSKDSLIYYNAWKDNITHGEIDYSKLKANMKYKLIHKLSVNHSKHQNGNEFMDFMDLLACLLDLNPYTRYNSEDAIRHRFIVRDYSSGKNDMTDNAMKKRHPIISCSNDKQRQNRINAQINQYLLRCKDTEKEVLSTETKIKQHLY